MSLKIRPPSVKQMDAAREIFAAGMRTTLTVGMRQKRWPHFLLVSSAISTLGYLCGGFIPSLFLFVLSTSYLFLVLPNRIASNYISQCLASDMKNIEARYIQPSTSGFWVALLQGDVCGTIAAEPPSEDGHDPESPWGKGDLELRRMSVAENYRGRGVARALFETLESQARAQDGIQRIVLSTSTFQASAVLMYPRLGFSVIKETTMFCGLFTIYYFAKDIAATTTATATTATTKKTTTSQTTKARKRRTINSPAAVVPSISLSMLSLSLLFLLMSCIIPAASEISMIRARSHSDSAPACPIYPDPRSVSVRDVLASTEMVEAFQLCDQLFQNASSSLPSGLIATIVFDQTSVWSKGYGYNDLTNKKQGPPTTDSLVRVASITKVFTSMLLFSLRDHHHVNLDDGVDKYLQNFSMQLADRAPSLRELASHTAGVPRELPYPCAVFNFPNSCNESYVLDLLKSHPVVSPTHRRFHYSNLGMALLGRALAHASFSSSSLSPPSPPSSPSSPSLAYEELVLSQIARPLGMDNATFAFNDTTKHRSAVGCSSDGKPVHIPYGPSCGFGAPAGCLWASAGDMERLMHFLFRIDPIDPIVSQNMATVDPFDSDTIAEMLAPSVLLRNGYEAVGTPFEMQYISNKYWTKGKQGELAGYRSSITVVEDLKLGVFTSALVTDVKSNSVWTIDALEILAPALDAALTRLRPLEKLPKNTAMYVGTYYDGSVKVYVNGTSLLFASGVGPDGEYATMLKLVDINSNGEELHVLRALDIVGLGELGCRWLDDGDNQELVKFVLSDNIVTAIEFMGEQFGKIVV